MRRTLSKVPQCAHFRKRGIYHTVKSEGEHTQMEKEYTIPKNLLLRNINERSESDPMRKLDPDRFQEFLVYKDRAERHRIYVNRYYIKGESPQEVANRYNEGRLFREGQEFHPP